MLNTRVSRIILMLCAGLLGSVMYFSVSSAADSFSRYVDKNGSIEFPTDFRTSMVHLDSWFVEDGGASGFHDVYTEASSVEAYRETGEFPDGATLVKELRPHVTGSFSLHYSWGFGIQSQ